MSYNSITIIDGRQSETGLDYDGADTVVNIHIRGSSQLNCSTQLAQYLDYMGREKLAQPCSDTYIHHYRQRADTAGVTVAVAHTTALSS